MFTKFIATKTVRFSGPASGDLLTFEVTYDNGDTWIPYNQLQGGSVSGVDEKKGWSIPHWPTSDTDWSDYNREKSYFCEHKWVDTGMRRTFCKECDIDGDYDPMTGKVTAIFKSKEK